MLFGAFGCQQIWPGEGRNGNHQRQSPHDALHNQDVQGDGVVIDAEKDDS